MKIETLIALPAAGKTDAILSHVLETKEKAVIASPSRVLSEQSYNKFKRMGGRAVLIDSTRLRSIKTVQASIMQSVKDGADVIFITHTALSNMERSKMFGDYALYIDEVPQLVEFNEYPFKSNLELITKHCEPIADESECLQNLVLKDSEKAAIKEKIESAKDGTDMIDSSLRGLYEALLEKKINVMVKHNEGHRKNGSKIVFLNDNKHGTWGDFKKVTIACANLFDTYSGKYLRYYANCDFVPSALESRLYFKEYKNTDRVNIILMTDSERWSRHQSETNNTFERLVDMVKNECGDDFIYTVNRDREACTNGIGERIPYGSYGLNSYIHHKNVAVMFSFNPQRWEIDILKGLANSCDLPTNEFLKARHVSDYLEPAFQLCLRCNLRDNESKENVNLYVPDWALVDYLKTFLPNANVITDRMISLECGERKGRKSFKKMFDFNEKENARFNGFKHRMKKKGKTLDPSDGESVEMVRVWITKQRKYNGNGE